MLSAQTGSHSNVNTRDRVYTAAQARRGKALYIKQCASCHGASLEGKGQNPPLAGDDFLNNWKGQTLGDLYTMLHSTMPATHPGSLSPAETVQAIAYILQANKFPSGKSALSSDPTKLRKIEVDMPHTKP